MEPAGLAPDTATDPDTTPDAELLAATVATVGIDADTGPFVQPPLTDPEGGSGRTCSRAARHTGPATATTAMHAVYFVPSDVKAQYYDRPIVCNDGYHEESTIGYAIMNARNWMASSAAQAAGPGSLKGKSYKRLKRTDSAYSRTFSFTDVRFFRSAHPDSYFRTDTFPKIINELNAAGWSNSKYMVFADVENWQGIGGTATYRGKFATGFRRIAYYDSAGNLVRQAVKWGCATDADTAAEHEMTHAFGAVPPSGSQEYDTKHPKHATGPGDVMYWKLTGTLSGKHTNGSAAPNTYWDVATDTYSSAVLGFGSYLESNGNVALRVC